MPSYERPSTFTPKAEPKLLKEVSKTYTMSSLKLQQDLSNVDMKVCHNEC